jgi:hypothetical protein
MHAYQRVIADCYASMAIDNDVRSNEYVFPDLDLAAKAIQDASLADFGICPGYDTPVPAFSISELPLDSVSDYDMAAQLHS